MGRNTRLTCDTRCQLLKIESINRENEIRRRWFAQNRQQLLDNLDKNKLDGIAKTLVSEPENKERKRDTADSERYVLPKLTSWRSTASDASENLNYMRPIKSSVRAMLYEKGKESNKAAQNYLGERYKEKREDRFYFPECNSWIYGWRMNDYPPVPLSKAGIRSIIRDTFYRRNTSGLQRDPDWYRACQTGHAKNFDEILTY